MKTITCQRVGFACPSLAISNDGGIYTTQGRFNGIYTQFLHIMTPS